MKKLLFLLSFQLSVFNCQYLFAQWHQTNEPKDSAICFAIKGDSVFTGTDGGVYLSTDNGGSWAAVNTGLTNTTIVEALAIGGGNIFAGTYNHGVFLSTNNGGSWTAKKSGLPSIVGTSLPVLSLAISGDGKYVFAGTYGLDTTMIITIHSGGVYLSTNDGTSWSAKNNGDLTAGTSVLSLLIDGANIFAGNNAYPKTSGQGVFLSTNNGGNWTAENTGLTNENVWSIDIIGGNLFAGTEAGVFLSTNNGGSWTNIGLASYNVRAFVRSGGNIFAGTVGGGVFLSPNNGGSWIAVNTGLTNTYIFSLAISGGNIIAGTEAGVWIRALSDILPSATISLQTNVSCNGGDNGGATVSASGGTPTYTYTWNTTPVQTAATATGLIAGTYTVTVSDANSFTATANVIITQPTAVSAIISSQTNVSCNGWTDGSATVSASGGTGSYTYLWTGGGTGVTKSSLAAGTYTVTVSDANACTTTANVTITVNFFPSTATSNSPVCEGQDLNLTASGGTSYNWSGPNSFSSTSQDSTITGATTSASGVYIVTVTNSTGCSAVDTVPVIVNTSPPTAKASSNSPVCAGQDINLTASGGTSYNWSGPNDFSSSSQNPTITGATALASGTYTVTVSNGCTATVQTAVTVNSADTSVSVSGATLTANASPAAYQWVNCGNGTVITGQSNQSFTATVNGNYAVIVTQNSCSDTSSCYNINITGIVENSFATAINIYPNPGTNKITIESPQQAVVEISNIQGQLIKSVAAIGNRTSVDVSAFPCGVYVVEVKTEKGVAVKKFVKE